MLWPSQAIPMAGRALDSPQTAAVDPEPALGPTDREADRHVRLLPHLPRSPPLLAFRSARRLPDRLLNNMVDWWHSAPGWAPFRARAICSRERERHREAFPKIGNCAERSQRLRAVPYWGGESNMLLFGFNGRATRNFLILLVSMH